MLGRDAGAVVGDADLDAVMAARRRRYRRCRRRSGENFTALDSRLITTCISWSRSREHRRAWPAGDRISSATLRSLKSCAGRGDSPPRAALARGRPPRSASRSVRPRSCARSSTWLIRRVSRSLSLMMIARNSLALARRQVGVVMQDLRERADRGQRRAQLVGDRRDEVVLEPVELLAGADWPRAARPTRLRARAISARAARLYSITCEASSRICMTSSMPSILALARPMPPSRAPRRRRSRRQAGAR